MGRSWRVFATALSFVVFGLGAVAVTATALLAIRLGARRPERRRRLARACIQWTFRAFLWFMQILRVVKLDIDARTAAVLAAERGSVVVANHPSFIDVIVLLAHIPQGNCVVKEAVWRNPLLSWGMRTASYIPNGDAEALLLASEHALRNQETLIVFPEATRTRRGKPIRLQRGAANIALRADATVRLVQIKCEPPLLSKGDPWYRAPPRQPCLAMRVGGSVRARDFLLAGEPWNIAARRLTLLLQQELSRDVSFDEPPGARAQTVAN